MCETGLFGRAGDDADGGRRAGPVLGVGADDERLVLYGELGQGTQVDGERPGGGWRAAGVDDRLYGEMECEGIRGFFATGRDDQIDGEAGGEGRGAVGLDEMAGAIDFAVCRFYQFLREDGEAERAGEGQGFGTIENGDAGGGESDARLLGNGRRRIASRSGIELPGGEWRGGILFGALLGEEALLFGIDEVAGAGDEFCFDAVGLHIEHDDLGDDAAGSPGEMEPSADIGALEGDGVAFGLRGGREGGGSGREAFLAFDEGGDADFVENGVDGD